MAASTKGIIAGKAFVVIGAMDKTESVLRGVQSRLNGLADSVMGLGTKLTALGSSITAPFIGFAKMFADAGDELHKMAIRTGMSEESLSGFGFAAEQSGASLGQFGTAVFRARRRIANATSETGPAVRALKELGLEAKTLNDLPVDQQFLTVAEAISKMGDESRAAQMAFEIFGIGGKSLIPMLQEGAGGIKKMMAEAKRLGIIMSKEDAASAAALTDALNRMWRTMKMISIRIGGTVAPMLTKMSNLIANISSGVIQWIKDNKDLLVNIFMIGVGLTLAGTAVIGLAMGIKVLAFTFGALATAFGVVSSLVSFLVSPMGMILVVIGAITAALWKMSSTFRGVLSNIVSFLQRSFGRLFETIKTTFGGILKALSIGDIQGAWEVLVTGMQLAWVQAIDSFAEVWNTFAGFFVNVWHGAMGKMKQMWFSAQSVITKGLLDIAAQEGIIGDILDTIIGVDVSGEKKKGVEAERARLQQLLKRETEDVPRINEEISQASQGIAKMVSDMKASGKDVDIDSLFDQARKDMRTGFTPEDLLGKFGKEMDPTSLKLRTMALELERARMELKNISQNSSSEFQDPLEQVKKDIENAADQNIAKGFADAETGIMAWKQSVESAKKQRVEEIQKRKKELDAILKGVDARVEARKMEEAKEFEAPKVDFPELATEVSQPLQALTGLQSGTVEAAKKAIENAQRGNLDKSLQQDKDRNKLLGKMNQNLANLADNVEGV